jgi:hypothetical protein
VDNVQLFNWHDFDWSCKCPYPCVFNGTGWSHCDPHGIIIMSTMLTHMGSTFNQINVW